MMKKKIVLMLVAVSLMAGSAMGALVDGLAGYWNLDETTGTTAADWTANSNNGTVTNTTFDADSVAGKFGNALNFDGSDDFVDVPNASVLNPTSAMSVSAWIKADSFGLGYWQSSIVDTSEWSGAPSGFTLRCGDNYAAEGSPTGLGKLSFSIAFDAGFPQAISATPTMATGTWYNVIGTYDGANIRAYIDGVEIATTPETRAIPTSPMSLEIGRSPGASARFFDGAIDDVAVWNRALTQAEITDIQISAIPEPMTLGLLGLGGLFLRRKKRC